MASNIYGTWVIFYRERQSVNKWQTCYLAFFSPDNLNAANMKNIKLNMVQVRNKYKTYKDWLRSNNILKHTHTHTHTQKHN